MPNYEEAAQRGGWEKQGSKWKHSRHPQKVYYSAVDVYHNELPEDLKRPTSVTPSVKPEPVEAKPEAKVEPVAVPVVEPKPMKAKGYGRS